MSSTTSASARPGAEFVGYEYTTLRVPRDLEPIYRDSFANFGWTLDSAQSTPPSAHTVTMTMKRDRNIKNRPMVHELQRTATHALQTIADRERSVTTRARGVAIAIGVLGTAFLAGSVFLLQAGLIIVSVLLGAIGILGWLAGWLVHAPIESRLAARVAPVIERQYAIVYDTTAKAHTLLRS